MKYLRSINEEADSKPEVTKEDIEELLLRVSDLDDFEINIQTFNFLSREEDVNPTNIEGEPCDDSFWINDELRDELKNSKKIWYKKGFLIFIKPTDNIIDLRNSIEKVTREYEHSERNEAMNRDMREVIDDTIKEYSTLVENANQILKSYQHLKTITNLIRTKIDRDYWYIYLEYFLDNYDLDYIPGPDIGGMSIGFFLLPKNTQSHLLDL